MADLVVGAQGNSGVLIVSTGGESGSDGEAMSAVAGSSGEVARQSPPKPRPQLKPKLPDRVSRDTALRLA
jgi:hypothetical protein